MKEGNTYLFNFAGEYENELVEATVIKVKEGYAKLSIICGEYHQKDEDVWIKSDDLITIFEV